MDIQKLLRNNIKNLKPYSSARDEFQGGTKTMVFLDANENPFENGVNRYPDPYQNALKGLLSELKDFSRDQILLGNGSDEVLDIIYRAFCEPKDDNILILPPTYGMYEVLAGINDVAVKKINLTSEFQLDVPKILQATDDHSKLLLLCSPNNPTGNSFSEKDLEKLISKFKGIVVLDEAYIDFSEKESWLKRLNEFPNLIVTQTLSKAYGMAGIRLGICYASKEIITVLNRIKPPYNVNILTQKKAIEQLQNKGLAHNQINDILEQRNHLKIVLKNIPFISKIYPSDANFLLVKVDDATKRYQQLLKLGIVTRNRTNEVGCENCLRLTVGTAEENKRIIEAFKSLSNLKSSKK
ncbi:histidinol-phosphate transaminase [Gaetbulibacter aestuarii]|uniref:Histidinol-phosphate aminotransferase n=1 Tax=Gaetbulibacter aestuarii TaxID=1502358 RepID=A0ABW7N0Z2_9FLAO